MKNLNLFIITFLLTAISFAQSNSINYKAIIKDGSGNVIANTAITVQFQILEDATIVYTETHDPITDANGLVILKIGEGSTVDTYNDINWGSDDHSLNVQIDTSGGTTYTDMGTTEFMSVPYAIHSLTSSSLSNQTNLSDIGIVSAFPGTTYPNDTYLPLNGGTYNNTDFPDFTTFIANLNSEVVTDNGNGTFTLANWNNNGVFLRGQGGNSGELGALQIASTSMPNTVFSANPPATTSSVSGAHQHSIRVPNHDVNSANSQGWPQFSQNSFRTTDRARSVLLDIDAMDSAGDHSHIIDIPAFNISGGDEETRPVNRSITWMIKVKPSVAFINNSALKMATSNSKSNNKNLFINDLKTKEQVEITKRDVFINNTNRGIIMKSQNGKCFRYQPNEEGLLIGKEIVCPNN